MANYCKECDSWERIYGEVGHCSCSLTKGDIRTEKPGQPMSDEEEAREIFTVGYFGCVHWRFKDMRALVDIDPEGDIDDDDYPDEDE